MTCEEHEAAFFAGGAGNLFARKLLVGAVAVLALVPQTLLFMCSKLLGETQVYFKNSFIVLGVRQRWRWKVSVVFFSSWWL